MVSVESGYGVQGSKNIKVRGKAYNLTHGFLTIVAALDLALCESVPSGGLVSTAY